MRPLGAGAKPNRIRKAGRQPPISGTRARNSVPQGRELATAQGLDQRGGAVLGHVLEHEQGHHRLDREALRGQGQPGPLHGPADEEVGRFAVIPRDDQAEAR